MSDNSAAGALERLLDVMARLLGPDGCPWDRQQTHRSLVPYLLEEAYELAEAIEAAQPTDNAGSPPNAQAALRDELGDVLLQVVFHAQLAQQAGTFDFAAVATGLTDKLIERHPHVFARERLDTAAAVSDAWDRRKLATRASRLDGIPPALPALMLASKLSSRAAKAGFEWAQTDDIYAKVQEELDEFRTAMGNRTSVSPDQSPPSSVGESAARDAAELELGDLLFCIVQLARWSEIDPERALRRASAKFAQRFRHMEQALRTQGKATDAVSEDEWWTLWGAAKAGESQR